MTRRHFFQKAVQKATGLALYAGRRLYAAPALNPDSLVKFVDPLPIPEIAKSNGFRAAPGKSSLKVPYFRVAMREVQAKLHRDLPATRLWCYGASSPGPTFETRSGQGLFIEWANELPEKHFLPIDHSLHGAEADKPEVRGVVHVHGAKAPPESDGYPEDWYVPGKSRTYFYPNRQDAAALWYHDHAMGINRLNIYAGMFGLFLIRDETEDKLDLPKGRFEIPLVICDRLLRQDGQLDYPVSPDPAKPWVPEVFGNVMVVNGKAFPFLAVEARPYRFRLLNVSNGRFLHLSLSNEQTFHQIGTDQGLLGAPVTTGATLVAPGERADLIVDFSGHAGKNIVLKNDAFEIMQFRVGEAKPASAPRLPSLLRPVPKMPERSAIKTRQLAIIENKTLVGESMMMLLNGMHWDMPVTEKPALNSVEIWSFINTTDDSHPIHLHLVRFQILDRRRFETFIYQSTGEIRYTDPAIPPAPEEAGWKDTVRADPGMVTRIIVRFEGYPGRYVWHCHVLEHEDNEMMRPYEVVAAR
ncbi:MAG TPA: multicopper oxidase [Bryobacteraceae bacterium]|jgi:spore coat protein A|nr:multicopper oxidase [Bryobacteraceae bacterium]